MSWKHIFAVFHHQNNPKKHIQPMKKGMSTSFHSRLGSAANKAYKFLRKLKGTT